MNEEAPQIWKETLGLLRERVDLQSYKTWLEPTRASSLDGNVLTVDVPNGFFVDWLEEHYSRAIRDMVNLAAGGDIVLKFHALDQHGDRQERAVLPLISSVDESQLHERYTFENFVVGKGNQLAHAAALAVANSPAQAYNPLFVYGGVGLGKTHLCQAIGNRIRMKYPYLKVYYTPAEEFLNEMIFAIQNEHTVSFKEKYRRKDLLLIDDIHFLAGKEGLQEEIFHTFNSLYDAGKQIVVTSDRPPKEIPTLQERLVSRFQWGLVADIQPPDLETRIAILKKKAERDGLTLADDVFFYIANNVRSNIRELEGCLIRLFAYSSIRGSEIDLKLAKEVLTDIVGEKRERVNVELIQKAVADFFDLSREAIRGRRRTASVALARQAAMYLSREHTGLSLKEIGAHFGGKDHSTVIHACEKITELIRNDPEFEKKIEKITHTILGD